MFSNGNFKRRLFPAVRILIVLICWMTISSPSSTSAFTCSSNRRQPKLLLSPILLSQPDRKSTDIEILQMEKEVEASALAKIDRQRLSQALATTTTTTQQDDDDDAYRQSSPQPLQIALAAASVLSIGSFLTVHSLIISTLTFTVVFILAWRDPIDADDDDVWGPIARILGRSTIRAVEKTTPKVKAVARAAMTEEQEIISLEKRIAALEEEVDELRLWKERRLAVDEAVADFSLEELKQHARLNNLQVGGKKHELLMRLVEAGVIALPEKRS
jgi:hypothetical protein